MPDPTEPSSLPGSADALRAQPTVPSAELARVLDELERLEKAATPGPWRADGFEIDQLSDAGEGYPLDHYPDCANVSTWVGASGEDGPYGIQRKEDAALIAAARNALPALLRAARERDELRARAERAEARVKELEERERMRTTACREQTPEERAALAPKETR